MTVILAQKDVEIITLKAAYVKGHEEGPGQNEILRAENELLHDKVNQLEAKVKKLTQQILNNHPAPLSILPCPFWSICVNIYPTWPLSCLISLSLVILVPLALFWFLLYYSGITCTYFYKAFVMNRV